MIQRMQKMLIKLLCLILVGMLFTIPAVQAQAPDNLYLQQETGNSCTLCSSTMMIRSCLYLGQTQDWEQVTESHVRGSAWTAAGLSWNWNYAYEDHSVTVGHMDVSGLELTTLETLLQAHPEGIVLYCGGAAPHAVFVTDLTNGTVYCADPAGSYSGSRIPLAESLLGTRHGDQYGILSATTAYWYIEESYVLPDRTAYPPEESKTLLKNVPARL